MMFDYKKCFDDYCSAHNLALHLSFSMPVGYETANGNFDPACKTVFINAKRLKNESDSTKAFFLFHELRHALQYLCPDQFSSTIQRSIQYIILYDGTCYKLANERYLKCQLDGGEEYFTDLYLSQPHEVDANTFAYKSVKKLPNFPVCNEATRPSPPPPVIFVRVLSAVFTITSLLFQVYMYSISRRIVKSK